jgi:hypothetical protein
MSLDLNHGIILNGRRRNSEPRGGGCRDSENGRGRRDRGEQQALHGFPPDRLIAID